MELAFESQEIRTICERQQVATEELGPMVAAALQRRLADLQAASSPSDLPIGRLHVSGPTSRPIMTLPLVDRHRLVFTSNHVNDPISSDGTVDLQHVTRLRILSVEVCDE